MNSSGESPTTSTAASTSTTVTVPPLVGFAPPHPATLAHSSMMAAAAAAAAAAANAPFHEAALRFALNNSPNTTMNPFHPFFAGLNHPLNAQLAQFLATSAAAAAFPFAALPSFGAAPSTDSGISSLQQQPSTSAAAAAAAAVAATISPFVERPQPQPPPPPPIPPPVPSMTIGEPQTSTAQTTAAAPTTVEPPKSADDALFRVPELPQKRGNGCNFCGALASPNAAGGPVVECDGCKTAIYCSHEHKNFDWKRHKPMCRTFQMRLSRSTTSMSSLASAKATADQMEAPINDMPIRPSPIHPHQLPKSSSTSSLQSMGAASSSASSQQTEKSSSSSNTNSSSDGAVDDDVQILESSPRRTRKRPMLDEKCPHGKGWKDHSKNLLFKTTLQDHMKSLAASGLAMNQHQAIALRLRYIAEHVIRSLNEYGWAVVDNFLGKTHCKYTYAEVEELFKRGLFKEGQLMDKKDIDPNATSNPTSTKDIRSDQIYWFDSSEYKARDAVTIRLLVSMIDSVIVHFAKRIPPYKIGGRSRAMIACYPGNGTRYVKHVDNPVRDGRCITSIYYCNDNWLLSEDGGTLRLYPETSQIPMDIDPQADRLIFFWSDHRNPHEVLPVFRHRYAITIWYFDQQEKQEALERQRQQDDNGNKAASQNGGNYDHHHGPMPRSTSFRNVAELNSAPIPQKPTTPPVSQPRPNKRAAEQLISPPRPAGIPVFAEGTSSSKDPLMEFRSPPRKRGDNQSVSTRSMLDAEDAEGEDVLVDVDTITNTEVPDFEV